MKKSHGDNEGFLIQLGSLLEAGGYMQNAVGQVIGRGLGACDAQGEQHRDTLLRSLDDMKAEIRRVEHALTRASSLLDAMPDDAPADAGIFSDGS
jgi:hypothetical protein